eukprot:s3566_g2.t1
MFRNQIDPAQILRCRWILTWKPVEEGDKSLKSGAKAHKAKARLVVLGYLDPKLTEIPRDSPTLNRHSKMLLLQLIASMSWTLRSFDVRAAFVQGKPQQGRTIGLEPVPELAARMQLGPDEICRLAKSAYGLIDAPFLWFQALKEELLTLGLIGSLQYASVHTRPDLASRPQAFGEKCEPDLGASNLAEMQAQMAMQDMFPQGRRAQMNRLDDFLHQHPLCPISESGMMAAMAGCNSWEGAAVQPGQGGNYQTTAVLGNAGFMMNETASSTTMGTAPALGVMHPAYPSLQMPAVPVMPATASFPGLQDPMMMMPATSLAPAQVPESMVSMPKPPARNNWETSHKLFVKNSFLHVEDSDEEEDDWNCDGASSHRSSSMPSRMSRDKEDRPYNRLPPAEMLELLYSLRNKPAAAASPAAHAGGAEGPSVSPILGVITEGATSSTQSAASYSGSA